MLSLTRNLRFGQLNQLFSNKVLNELLLCSTKTISSTPWMYPFFLSDVMNLKIPNASIVDFVWKDIDKWADKTAIECSVTGRSYTYHRLYHATRAFAANLRNRLKLKDGDTVAIVLPNVPEYAIAFLGTLQANLIVSPVNPLYTADEQYHQFLTCQAKCIVTIDELYPVILNATKKLSLKIPIISMNLRGGKAIGNAIDIKEFVNKSTDTSILNSFDKIPIEDVAVLPYSSGTTGFPKAVELSNRNLVSNMCQLQHDDYKLVTDTSIYQDTVAVVLPMFHMYGLVVCFLDKLSLGCKLITLPSFTSKNFVSLIKKNKPDVLFAVPPIVMLMTVSKDLTVEDLNCLRVIMSGAAPLRESDYIKFLEKAGRDIICCQGYGLTETSPVVAIHDIKMRDRNLSSSGKLLPNTKCRIVDLDTNTCQGLNKPGEITISGPQVMRGYRDNPQANEDVFTPDGWFRTGDIGYLDKRGQLFVTDRLKELIKVKGFQVAPAELEALLRTHVSVKDAAVVGIPDPMSGEAPRAFIVPKESSRISEEEIKAFIASKLAPHKHLKGGVKFVDMIPKSSAGKILRRQIVAEYCK